MIRYANGSAPGSGSRPVNPVQRIEPSWLTL